MPRLYDIAKAYAASHTERDGKTWAQNCQSLMFRFNQFRDAHGEPQSYDSALIAAHASKIESRDAAKAPIGAFHFWDIGQFGHVAQDLTGGGRTVFMASTHIAVAWGDAIGTTSVAKYNALTRAKYLGWSRRCGVYPSRTADDLGIAYTAVPRHAAADPQATPWRWEKPARETQMLIQGYLHARNRYAGDIDGKWGPLTITGIQITVHNVGYEGVYDGKPGPQTCRYVQIYAREFAGWPGKIDGVLTQEVWEYFARGLTPKKAPVRKV